MNHRRVNPRTIVIIAIIVCLVAAAVFLLIRFFPSFGARTETTPNTTQQDPDSPAVSAGGEKPEGTQTSDQKIGSLTVTYSGAELTRVDGEDGLVTLLPDAAQTLPRLDFQNLNGSLQDLTDEEVQRLAVGMVQSYYVGAPAADTITVTADQALLHAYLVEVPAAGDTPALEAQVRFLEASDGLWCLVLLHTADQDAPTALLSAYETVAAD